jgi:Holliday junction resolvase
MPNGENVKKGRENEEIVSDYYRKKGYQVISTNENGFPDLIVLKGKQVLFFVEVKQQGVRLETVQEETIAKWEKESFETKLIDVRDGKIVRIYNKPPTRSTNFSIFGKRAHDRR